MYNTFIFDSPQFLDPGCIFTCPGKSNIMTRFCSFNFKNSDLVAYNVYLYSDNFQFLIIAWKQIAASVAHTRQISTPSKPVSVSSFTNSFSLLGYLPRSVRFLPSYFYPFTTDRNNTALVESRRHHQTNYSGIHLPRGLKSLVAYYSSLEYYYGG